MLPTSSMSGPGTQTKDPTFRNYSSKNADEYAKYRKDYPPAFIKAVLDAHIANDVGKLGAVVDVGCGPGTATRQLATHFEHAFGLDPGASMIDAASNLGGETKSGEAVKFAVTSAEEIDLKLKELGVQEGTVDLVTAATAAHWFELPKFYTAAGKMLRPGGSIALWAGGSWHAAKWEVPNADKVQALLDKFELDVLAPYELPGNRLTRELYSTIDLPWTSGVEGFDEGSYYYKTWNKDGEFEPELENGFMRYIDESWEKMEKALGTVSMVTRWREANKEKLESGEMEDCVTVLRRELEETVNEGKKEGEEGYYGNLSGGTSFALVMWKKK